MDGCCVLGVGERNATVNEAADNFPTLNLLVFI